MLVAGCSSPGHGPEGPIATYQAHGNEGFGELIQGALELEADCVVFRLTHDGSTVLPIFLTVSHGMPRTIG